jgi:hypothetical protein
MVVLWIEICRYCQVVFWIGLHLRDSPHASSCELFNLFFTKIGCSPHYASLQAPVFLKSAAQDAILTTSSTDGRNTPIRVPVPAGTRITIDVLGIHYNRKFSMGPSQLP